MSYYFAFKQLSGKHVPGREQDDPRAVLHSEMENLLYSKEYVFFFIENSQICLTLQIIHKGKAAAIVGSLSKICPVHFLMKTF